MARVAPSDGRTPVDDQRLTQSNGPVAVNADELRRLAPSVLGVLVRRGADPTTAEDAVQEAMIRALSSWEAEPPADPEAWLITVAWRAFLDIARARTARHRRESRIHSEPPSGDLPALDDTLRLYFLCAHPDLTPTSAIALTLRAVGGLTTAQIANAYLVPEATVAQRISRAKRTIADSGIDQPGHLANVMKVLYLVFNEGYSGDVDLAAEAIRLTRQLEQLTDHPDVAGLLALMLLHHARRDTRTDPDGRIVTLTEQDRTRWDASLIAEGVQLLQAALARDRLGEYQCQAAIAALHADAATFAETDWAQIVEWYDELLVFTDTPIVRLNRVVALGESDGPVAGLAALADIPNDVATGTKARTLLTRTGSTSDGSAPGPPHERGGRVRSMNGGVDGAEETIGDSSARFSIWAIADDSVNPRRSRTPPR